MVDRAPEVLRIQYDQVLHTLYEKCHHCGPSETCWETCAALNKNALEQAGCLKKKTSQPALSPCRCGVDDECCPLELEQTAKFLQVGGAGGEPASCIRELKKVCGQCGADKKCYLSCGLKHKADLIAP